MEDADLESTVLSRIICNFGIDAALVFIGIVKDVAGDGVG